MKDLYLLIVAMVFILLFGCEECINSTECTAGSVCTAGDCVAPREMTKGDESHWEDSTGDGGVDVPDGGQERSGGSRAFPFNNSRPISGGNSRTVRELDTDCIPCG